MESNLHQHKPKSNSHEHRTKLGRCQQTDNPCGSPHYGNREGSPLLDCTVCRRTLMVLLAPCAQQMLSRGVAIAVARECSLTVLRRPTSILIICSSPTTPEFWGHTTRGPRPASGLKSSLSSRFSGPACFSDISFQTWALHSGPWPDHRSTPSTSCL